MIVSPGNKGRRPSIRRNRLIFCLLVLAFTILAVVFISEDAYILSLGREIQNIKKRRIELETENVTLKLKVAELRKGSRIKQIAHDNLGMELPVGAPRKLF